MTTISKARPRDLPDIHKMIKALSAFHGDTAAVSLAQLQDFFFDAPVASALLAKDHAKTVGYAALVPHTRLHAGSVTLDIQHLFIAEGHRGRGLGRRLINAALAEARKLGCFRVTIGTDPENTAAQAAYRAIGFDDINGSHPRFQIML